MEDSEPIGILAILAKVSRINGVIDQKEQKFIHHMGERLGVREELIAQILAGELTAEISPPTDEWERIPYFQMCVMLSGVNGDFDEREALFCKKLGLKLGLRDSILDRVIDLLKEYYPKEVPLEQLRAAYQIGHN